MLSASVGMSPSFLIAMMLCCWKSGCVCRLIELIPCSCQCCICAFNGVSLDLLAYIFIVCLGAALYPEADLLEVHKHVTSCSRLSARLTCLRDTTLHFNNVSVTEP